jgi:branched-chain amino acid transport system permease protein
MTLRGLLGWWMVPGFLLLASVPFLPGRYVPIYGTQLIPLLCLAILALGLNVVVGYSGLLHLGIAAFFGIGAYTAGILSTSQFPLQASFLVVAVAAPLASAAVGVITTAPTLRLRGDYFALVTLGFGLITFYLIKNLDAITDGTKGLTPISPNFLPGLDDPTLPKAGHGWGNSWRKYPYLYFLCLGLLTAIVIFLGNLERSRLGRAWVALREDELAASCMGLNPARLKLSAIALGAALAGLAGALFAISQDGTTDPRTYWFDRSMIAICCVILGGLGNRPGVILGVFLLVGYDQILTPIIDNWLQAQKLNPNGKEYLKVSGWRLFIFGAALILMMRFRPEGLLPAARQKRELHPEVDEAAGEAAAKAEVENKEPQINADEHGSDKNRD